MSFESPKIIAFPFSKSCYNQVYKRQVTRASFMYLKDITVYAIWHNDIAIL